jgi:hypothetical protein
VDATVVTAAIEFTTRLTGGSMTLSKAIQLAADAAVVIVCIGIAAYLLRPTAARRSASAERDRVLAGSYQPGDTVAPLPGVDFGAAHKTLLIVTKSDCSFCRASYPFYRRLLSERERIGKPVRIVMFAPRGDIAGSSELLRTHGLKPDALVPYTPRDLKVRVTPTLVLVDQSGRVVDVWLGQAEPADQADIQAQLFR